MKIIASLLVGVLLGFAASQWLKSRSQPHSNSISHIFSGADLEETNSEFTALELLSDGDSQSAQLILAAALNMRVDIARKSSALSERQEHEVEMLAIKLQPHNVRLGLAR